uniref:HEPN AbiJ-N-terminal domain-containing protein n=1 Tax=candidate division WOR-3 bacterium TaxID=2052148 RepID=A0A7V3ZX07_UNCW3
MENLFSDRYKYKRKIYLNPEEVTDSLKKRIYNLVEKCLENPELFELHYENEFGSKIKIRGKNRDKLIEILWDEFFKEDIQVLRERYKLQRWAVIVESEFLDKYSIKAIRDKYYELKEWYLIYDFIEFIINRFNPNERFISLLNNVFKAEGAPYRVIGKYVAPSISEVEVNELEQALNIPDKYESVRTHISQALRHFSQKPNPDYKNSIKESILGLESLLKIILNTPKGTLGELVNKLSVHPALKEALKKLYGWTSDEDGIRHAKPGEKTTSSEEEARFLLVISSAFVNYIISKYEKQLTKEN